MKQQVLAIFDQASAMFMTPMYTPSLGAGIRAFSDLVNRAEDGNPLNLHPADYNLFHIGVFDNCTGEYTPAAKRCVAQGEHIYTGPPRQPTVYEPTVIRQEVTTGNHQ